MTRGTTRRNCPALVPVVPAALAAASAFPARSQTCCPWHSLRRETASRSADRRNHRQRNRGTRSRLAKIPESASSDDSMPIRSKGKRLLSNDSNPATKAKSHKQPMPGFSKYPNSFSGHRSHPCAYRRSVAAVNINAPATKIPGTMHRATPNSPLQEFAGINPTASAHR